MPSTFFTTEDGDVILHDFRVHRFILSLASPVIKYMFTFTQPPDQTLNERRLPVVGVSGTPEVLDIIAPITLSLKGSLKKLLPTRSVWVLYLITSWFGFSEVVKEAAEVSGVRHLSRLGNCEDLQHISSTDLFRLVEFIQAKGYAR